MRKSKISGAGRLRAAFDIAALTGWTAFGLINLLFFILHASVTNVLGLFTGEASVSFTFMAASAFFMLSVSALIIFLLVKRGALMRRARNSLPFRIARYLLAVLAAFFIVVTAFAVSASSPGPVVNTPEMLILGAYVSQDGPSVTLQGRLEAGVEYAAAHPDVRIIVSGGQGLDEPVSEASAMRDFLVSRGIDEKRIILEEYSHNTLENMKNTYAKLDAGGGSYPIVVVTSEFHILRASMIARRVGFEPYFIAAKTPLGLLPGNYSREFFGMIKSFIIDF